MKMALCIYGKARTFQFCSPSVKELILDVYHPDTFVCSEEQGDRLRETYNTPFVEIREDRDILHQLGTPKYPEWQEFPEWPQYHLYTPQEMCYRFRGQRCGEMLKAQEQKTGIYDVVLVMRPDIKYLYFQPITIPNKNTLYLPKTDAHQYTVDEKGLWWKVGYSGHTWWADSILAKTLLENSWSEEAYKNVGVWSGEMLLKWYCDNHNINIEHVDVTQMIIKWNNGVPYSDSFEFGKPLSATHYPQYCNPPLPIEGHIPVPLPKPGGPPVGGRPPEKSTTPWGW
jgi:hypothetical protein